MGLPINDSYHNILNQFQTINKSEGSNALEVDKKTGGLSVVVSGGRVWNYFATSLGYTSSQDPSNWKNTATKISETLKETKTLLDSQNQFSPKEISNLRRTMIISSEVLTKMADNIYASDTSAKEKFLELAKQVNELSILLKTPEFEEDFFVVENKIEPETPETDEIDNDLSDWSFIENKGSAIENSDQAFEELNVLSQEWEMVDRAEDWNFKAKSENSIQKFGRVLNTLKAWVTGTKAQSSQHVDVPSPWEQFGSNIVYGFLESLKKKESVQDFDVIEPFYKLPKTGINKMTKEQVLKIIDDTKITDFSKPICIPMILSGKEGLSRDHIVGMIIKDGTIEYFDSMGIPSNNQVLADNTSTLRDIMEACKEKFNLNEVVENQIQIQSDVHNCGVFVCDFFIRRLEKQEIVGSMKVEMSDEELYATREHVLNDAIQFHEEHYRAMTQQATSMQSSTSEDDFDMSSNSEEDFEM